MSSRLTERFTCSHCSRIFERKDGLGTHFSHAHRDVNGAEDLENAEKEPVLESPGDLEIEVAESLLRCLLYQQRHCKIDNNRTSKTH